MAGHATWKDFFDAHAPFYDQNPFAQNTVAEVDFFVRLFGISPGARILDVGCGTGRHSVELAKRGFRVTGLDISPGMLAVAAEKASQAGVSVEWVEQDAREISVSAPYDAALCLCEGGVGIVNQGDDPGQHDPKIIASIARALKPNAPFLLTTLNGYMTIRQMKDEFIADGRFDPATMISQYQDQWDLPEGPALMNIRERLYIPPEMVRILQDAGFQVDAVYGGTAGHWAQRPVSLDEIEAMYVCRRA